MSDAAPNDVIQKVVKPHMTVLMIVESVTDDAVIAYIPMAPERYRVKHDDYAVIGQAAVVNPMAAQETPPTPVAAPRNGAAAPVAQARPRSTAVRVPGRPFEQFRKIQVNPDIVPDGAPIRADRPRPDAPVTPSLAEAPAMAEVPPNFIPENLDVIAPPPTIPRALPQEPKRKRKLLAE